MFLTFATIAELRSRQDDRVVLRLEREAVTRTCSGDSLKEMWAELDRVSAGYLRVGDQLLCQLGHITDPQKRCLEQLRVPLTIRLGSE